MPRSLLPQLLHRLVVVAAAAAVDMAEAADTVEVDMAEVDMAVGWPVDTVWVVGTALVEAFTAGWVEAPVAR
ncbi:MAG TPA: hypothetical protein VFR54_02715 [Xanthobacteraceae bacterium]|nr:hypothetical protein [Xanthobacteraceae bacterium]